MLTLLDHVAFCPRCEDFTDARLEHIFPVVITDPGLTPFQYKVICEKCMGQMDLVKPNTLWDHLIDVEQE